jgi:hypothetical protein
MLIRNSGISVQPELEDVTAMSRFAFETRYPGDFETIAPDEIEHAIELAEKAVAWARIQTGEFQKNQ